MNMIARAGGFKNVQHMRAARSSHLPLSAQPDVMPVANTRRVARALNQFDPMGRLRQWPSRRSVQTLALWAFWAAFPARMSFCEAEVNARLVEEHCFDDPATLRRTMIACGLFERRPDGTDYRRIEREPPAEAKALIHAISARRRTRGRPRT